MTDPGSITNFDALITYLGDELDWPRKMSGREMMH